jgi:hypothetical protein
MLHINMWDKCYWYANNVQNIQWAIFQAHDCERRTNSYITVWNCMKWRLLISFMYLCKIKMFKDWNVKSWINKYCYFLCINYYCNPENTKKCQSRYTPLKIYSMEDSHYFSLFHRAFSYSLFNNPTYALLSYNLDLTCTKTF